MWGDNPHATILDPDADRPQLVGSTWVRKQPEGDSAWDTVRVVGVWDNGADSAAQLELVVQTVAFTGEPTLTANAESFVQAYRREDETDATLENISARLRELEGRVRG